MDPSEMRDRADTGLAGVEQVRVLIAQAVVQ